MQLRKTLVVMMLSLDFLSGCSLLNSEKDIVIISSLPKVENQFTPIKIWSSPVGSGFGRHHSSLRLSWLGGNIFAADRKGLVKAMDLASGKELWHVDLSTKRNLLSLRESALLSGGVTVSGNHLYIGNEHAEVFALNATDGTFVWETIVTGEVLSRPVVSNGLVLVHTSSGILQALNESDGAIKWTINLDIPPLSLRGESAPAATAFGTAIVGGDNGRVSALLINQGQLIWKHRISQLSGTTEIDHLNDVDATPVVAGDIVYVVGYNTNMTALDVRSGQTIWKRELCSVQDFVVKDDCIYIVDQISRVVALSTKDGVNLWQQSDLLHRNLTSPALYNNYLVVGDSEGYLYWINTMNGHLAAQHKVDSSGFLNNPIVASNKLLIQARKGEVYAFTC
ncbi:MAG: outer membrane protein assembly factor BamB [Candidatus Malihini olakiniferum]